MRPNIENVMQNRLNTAPGLGARSIYQADMNVLGAATQQQKIIAACRSLGIRDAEIMQATTRTIFDSLPFTAVTNFEFFKGVQNRAFPFTNLPENKLEVGEAMIVDKIILFNMTVAAPPVVTTLSTFDAGTVPAMPSQFTFTIANSDVIKPFDLCNYAWQNNIDSKFPGQQYIKLQSYICIPSLQEFVLNLTLQPNVPVGANDYIGVGISGTGIIYRTNSPL